ncbi:hypothetical protein P171DRAFT_445390 [Karstenula rhodostoma CBS 690.94]|uniref:Secreted protein n=1 Tax=Karstenula rhodostoma CBS 690.94 TaxID=1392251 RepID=A0A9P4PF13_9PLEO|nr:hypothetical protein P171DRAFT_445390 [Karstenula rhodostoma CBS 690.94]
MLGCCLLGLCCNASVCRHVSLWGAGKQSQGRLCGRVDGARDATPAPLELMPGTATILDAIPATRSGRPSLVQAKGWGPSDTALLVGGDSTKGEHDCDSPKPRLVVTGRGRSGKEKVSGSCGLRRSSCGTPV